MTKITNILIFLVIILSAMLYIAVSLYLNTKDELVLEKNKTVSYEKLLDGVNNAEVKTQKSIKNVKETKKTDENNKKYLNVDVPADIIDILCKNHLSAVGKAKN